MEYRKFMVLIGIAFIIFGSGVYLAQLIGMPSGFYFTGIGLLLFLIFLLKAESIA